MKVKNFSDTDTALILFNNKEVAETKVINDNILIDLDMGGNLVSMTIEHANKPANLTEFSIELVTQNVNA